MSNKVIDGSTFARMLRGGTLALLLNAEEVNDLNVFPVADGDTGTNMAKTMDGGVVAIGNNTGGGICEVARAFARGVMLSARGNSGVILSQIFAGISEGLDGVETATAAELASAYQNGIKKSYAAVSNPTEGTILTVFRESADFAASRMCETSDIEDFFSAHIEEATRSLARTKELLPALAEADVIDSGGKGYLYIAEGMYSVLLGKSVDGDYVPMSNSNSVLDIDRFTRDSVLEFGYCTEFLLRLTTAKCDIDSFDESALISSLASIGGESIVAYKDGDIVKVHVHVFEPGAALAAAQKYGEFLTVKIENMSLGHSGAVVSRQTDALSATGKPKKPFATIAVAQGEGMSALFSSIGADAIVPGGETCNPSIQEFLSAFEGFDCEHIIVLPNNKNVILAAKQAAELYDRASVHVIETRNMMQGYSALSVITPGIKDVDAIVKSATRAASDVVSIEITAAVRDAVADGHSIHKGEYMAILDGEIVTLAESAEDAVLLALKGADADLCEIITLFVGQNVSEEARAELTERIGEEYGDLALTVYNGGQDVYDYLVALE